MMKTLAIHALAHMTFTAAASAAVTSFDNLEVKESGAGNTVLVSSLVVGYGSFASYNSATFGTNNWAHEASFTAGISNKAKNISGAIGNLNEVNYAAAGQYPRHSVAFGLLNTILGNSCLASGRSNDITADQASTLGYELICTSNDATIVGRYNEDKPGVLFVVGQGDASNRQNALEVHDNGDVILRKPQGDISMGIYGQ